MQVELEQTYPRLGTIYSLCSVYYPNIWQRSDVLNRWNFLKAGFYEGIKDDLFFREYIFAKCWEQGVHNQYGSLLLGDGWVPLRDRLHDAFGEARS